MLANFFGDVYNGFRREVYKNIVMRYEELLVRVKNDYPELNLRAGDRFLYRPPKTVVFEQKNGTKGNFNGGNSRLAGAEGDSHGGDSPRAAEIEQNNYTMQFLHEVGHALLGHWDFATDVERVKMECAAWEKARELCVQYQVDYDEEFAENELDTYRNWLHQKSKCPECGLTRYQDKAGKYHCPQCEMFR